MVGFKFLDGKIRINSIEKSKRGSSSSPSLEEEKRKPDGWKSERVSKAGRMPHGISSFSKRLQAEPDLPLYRACEMYNALIKFLSGRLSRLIRPPAHLHNPLTCLLACLLYEGGRELHGASDPRDDNEANNIREGW